MQGEASWMERSATIDVKLKWKLQWSGLQVEQEGRIPDSQRRLHWDSPRPNQANSYQARIRSASLHTTHDSGKQIVNADSLISIFLQ